MIDFGSTVDFLTPITANLCYCLNWLNHFHPFVWREFSPSLLELILTFIIFEKMISCLFAWVGASSDSVEMEG